MAGQVTKDAAQIRVGSTAIRNRVKKVLRAEDALEKRLDQLITIVGDCRFKTQYET